MKLKCIDESIIHGNRRPVSFTCALKMGPGYRKLEETKIKHCNQIMNQIKTLTFSKKDNDNNVFHFRDETIALTKIPMKV